MSERKFNLFRRNPEPLQRDPQLHKRAIHDFDESFLVYLRKEIIDDFKTDWWLIKNPDVLVEWAQEDWQAIKEEFATIGRALAALPSQFFSRSVKYPIL